MSSIALRQHTFNVGPFAFSHNFLVLYDDRGNVVSELHGLPADPATGQETGDLVGRSRHNLRAFEYSGKRWYQDGQSEKPLW